MASERRAAFNAEFREGQVDGAAVWTDKQAVAALQTKFGSGWIDGLTVGTTHRFLIFPGARAGASPARTLYVFALNRNTFHCTTILWCAGDGAG